MRALRMRARIIAHRRQRMFNELSEMLNLRTMEIGSTLYVLEKMAPQMSALDIPRLSLLHEEALAMAETASKANLRWLNQKELNKTARRDARDLKHGVDRQVGSLHQLLKLLADLPSGTPRALSARKILNTVFARGALAYTSLPFNEEYDQVRQLINILRNEMLFEVAQVGLDDVIDGTEALNTAYGEALQQDVERIDFEQVSQTRNDATIAFHKFLIVALGELIEQPDELDTLLEPLRLQQKRLTESLRRNRTSA